MGIFGSSQDRSPQDQVDLDHLKDRVARLEAAVAQLQAQLQAQVAAAPPPGGTAAPAAASATGEPPWMHEVRALKAQGKMIHAIKAYRAGTGVGLAEAKIAVERLY